MTHLDVSVIRDLLTNQKTTRLKQIISHAQIADLAVLIDQLTKYDKLKFYLLIPTKISSEVLLEMSQHSRRFILKSLKDKYIVSLIKRSESDDSADILGEVPAHRTKRIIANLPKETKEQVTPLIKYEEDTAGGIMQTEVITFSAGTSVKEACKKLEKDLKEMDGVNYVYVTDRNDKLKGVVSIQDLVISPGKKKLSSVMRKDVVKLNPDMDEEKVAHIFRAEDIMALPVVDKRGKLLGRVTVDDVLDVIETEATEDMFKIAGVHPDEHVFDPLSKSLKHRLPWLVLNLFTAIIAAFVISLFSSTLEAVVILAAFMPIIAGMGGNAGTQTLTLIVRGIALNQLNLTNYKKVMLKEMTLGMINGTITGLLMAVIAYFWTGNIMIGVIILVSMIINLLVAGFIATAIPILLKVCKVDPAVSSTVFITTFTDVVGFFSFLGIATLLIQWLV